jgi:hypothetical protein
MRERIYDIGELETTVVPVRCECCGKEYENTYSLPHGNEIMVDESKYGFFCEQCYYAADYACWLAEAGEEW